MLTELGLENFKSWEKVDAMRLAPITGLFGANSSGKTSILQILLLLKQTATSPDRAQALHLGDERSLVSLGTFRDVLFRHQESSRLRWSLRWELPRELKVTDPERPGATLFSDRSLGFDATVSENGSGRMIVDRFAYSFAGRDFSMAREVESGGRYQLLADASDFSFRRSRGRPWELPPPLKCYGFPDQVRAYYQNAEFLADFELAFEEVFDRTYYLGPLREYPRRQYAWGGSQPLDMGQRGERVVDALLAAHDRGIVISRGKGRKRLSLEAYVGLQLRELGLIHEFEIEAVAPGSNLYRVWVRRSPNASRVLITDVGFGVSQILPVLVLCYYVPEGSIVLLEQPEIHLHPAVQAGLADVLIDAVKRRHIQIILESHSEHLLRRLQRRIAEEQICASDAALYFCEMVDGVSTLTPLNLDPYGNVTNWPEAFIGDAFGDAAAKTRAEMQRRQQDA